MIHHHTLQSTNYKKSYPPFYIMILIVMQKNDSSPKLVSYIMMAVRVVWEYQLCDVDVQSGSFAYRYQARRNNYKHCRKLQNVFLPPVKSEKLDLSYFCSHQFLWALLIQFTFSTFCKANFLFECIFVSIVTERKYR